MVAVEFDEAEDVGDLDADAEGEKEGLADVLRDSRGETEAIGDTEGDFDERAEPEFRVDADGVAEGTLLAVDTPLVDALPVAEMDLKGDDVTLPVR